MYLDQTPTFAGRKTCLAAGLVLLASCFAMGSTAAQSRAGRATMSSNAPDRIYHDYCSVCHGEKGDGKSLARFALNPQPKDFTAEKTRKELSRVHMIETLNKGARTKEGKPTAMVAWQSQLSRQQIEAVVDYVIIKFMDGKVAPNDQPRPEGQKHEGHDHSTANVMKVDYPYGLKASAARGKSIYAANCTSCHGAKGDGRDNPGRSSANQPRSFRDPDFREFASGFSLFSAIAEGNGHVFASSKTLNNQNIADVSEYVLRTLVQPRRIAAGAP